MTDDRISDFGFRFPVSGFPSVPGLLSRWESSWQARRFWRRNRNRWPELECKDVNSIVPFCNLINSREIISFHLLAEPDFIDFVVIHSMRIRNYLIFLLLSGKWCKFIRRTVSVQMTIMMENYVRMDWNMKAHHKVWFLTSEISWRFFELDSSVAQQWLNALPGYLYNVVNALEGSDLVAIMNRLAMRCIVHSLISITSLRQQKVHRKEAEIDWLT